MAKGECNCGEVAFEIKNDPMDVYICHCSICRRATGANGIAVTVVANNDFCWLKGKELVKTWEKPGHDWQTSFCQNCGSTLPGSNDDSRMYVPVGLLSQEAEQLQVAGHIWVGSKAVWDEIGDKGKQYSEAFA